MKVVMAFIHSRPVPAYYGSAWMAVVQHPYPEGNSIIPFVVTAVGTPAINVGDSRWRVSTRARIAPILSTSGRAPLSSSPIAATT